jgi:hypothetical protein
MHSNTHNAAEPSGSLTCEGGACGSATYPVEWNLIAITRVPSPEIRRNTIGSERASIDCGYSYPGNYFDLAVFRVVAQCASLRGYCQPHYDARR